MPSDLTAVVPSQDMAHRISVMNPSETAGISAEIVEPEWRVHLRTFKSLRVGEEHIQTQRKNVSHFYSSQNQFIDDLESSALLVEGESATDEEESNKGHGSSGMAVPSLRDRTSFAIRVSFFFNVLLFGAKMIVAIQSGSLSVIASAVDSFLDLFSGLVLTMSNKAANERDPFDYPSGKQRLEPVGLVVFSSVMGMVSLTVIIEGLKRLIAQPEIEPLDNLALALLGAVVAVKGCLWLYCRTITGSPTADAQAQDHKNDILTNSFGALAAWLGGNVMWWIDPVGAMLFSFFIMVTWVFTGLENMNMLVGKAAPSDFLQRLTFIAFHHPGIQKVDTVRAFHFGTNYLVEVDIVMSPETLLRESHDVGESLQIKLERLPEVDRAFVHVDYEYQHKPDSEHKTV
eukprot:GFYU01011458.1.p1 GENE.GFYU01011458.1~~GFYU01011458.1.p1  ORF type:complete len:419 (+),score=124.40 GFYU01011458.1:57-1259(+)